MYKQNALCLMKSLSIEYKLVNEKQRVFRV